MKPEWRFTSENETSVCAAFEDGHCESHSIDADIIQAWLAKGNTPLPYEPPPVDLKAEAKAALDRCDMTALRCYKAGVPWPNEWKDYNAALRGIVSGANKATALPAMPKYPAGS